MEIPRENLGGEITLAVSRPPSAADTDPNRLVDSAFRTLVRSTTSTGRGVVADALRAVDPVGARSVEHETAWRSRYLQADVAALSDVRSGVLGGIVVR